MKRLEYYQQKFKNLPIQGTTEWLEGRLFSFGGSEMACVCDSNPYETFEDLKDKKIKQQNLSTDATEWGKLFEPVAKQLIEKQFSKIYEFGSIPHPYYPVCYSPDGLMVIDDQLVLLEIKTPLQRGIKKIPENYIFQVQTGLNVIAAHHCLFAQFRFRRCKVTTSPLTCSYDRAYHLEYRKRQADMKPFQWGFFHWDTKQPFLDLASLPSMCAYLKNVTVRPVLKMFKCVKENDEMWKNVEIPQTGAVLMWKCFEVSYSSIKPDKTFLSIREELLWKKYEEMREDSTNKKEPLISQGPWVINNVTQEVVTAGTKHQNQSTMHAFCTKSAK